MLLRTLTLLKTVDAIDIHSEEPFLIGEITSFK
jgi:hypothetical protein